MNTYNNQKNGFVANGKTVFPFNSKIKIARNR